MNAKVLFFNKNAIKQLLELNKNNIWSFGRLGDWSFGRLGDFVYNEQGPDIASRPCSLLNVSAV